MFLQPEASPAGYLPPPAAPGTYKMERAKSCNFKKSSSSTLHPPPSSLAPEAAAAAGGGSSHHHVHHFNLFNRSNSFHHGAKKALEDVALGGTRSAATSREGLNKDQQQQQQDQQQGKPKPKFKMKETTKILLKLHVIHTKAVSLERHLQELQELTEDCQVRNLFPPYTSELG